MPSFRSLPGASRRLGGPPGGTPTSYFIDVHDVLHLTDLTRGVWYENVVDGLDLVQNGAGAADEDVVDDLDLADVVTDQIIVPVADQLAIVDSLTVQQNVHINVHDVLTLAQGVIATTPRSSRSCSDVPDATIGSLSQTTLTYPFISPSTTVILRNPKFGNMFTLNTNTKFPRTRSGQLNPIRGAAWPTIQVMGIQFEALSPQQQSDFKNFCETSAGAEVGLLDWENRQWRGVILTDTIQVQKHGIDDCSYVTSFQFRGRLA